MKLSQRLVNFLLNILEPEKAHRFSNVDNLTSECQVDRLYELGENILKIKQLSRSGQYPLRAFQTLTGGIPNAYGNLSLPVVAFRTSEAQMPSYLLGGFAVIGGISGTVFVRCRRLQGVVDLDNRQIYQANNGTLFVYVYNPPTMEKPYDSGLFTTPRIELESLKTITEAFAHVSEILVGQVPGLDEITRLSLQNRVTELQTTAYQQGRTYDGVQSSELGGS